MRQTTLTNEPTRTLGYETVSIHTHTLPVADLKCRTVVVSAAHTTAAARGTVVVVTTCVSGEWCELAHPESIRAAVTIA